MDEFENEFLLNEPDTDDEEVVGNDTEDDDLDADATADEEEEEL